MKQLLLITGMSALASTAIAQNAPLPKTIENSDAYAISANAKYLVSDGYSGLRIYNIEANASFDYTDGSDYGKCFTGFANCVSDNGIIIGYDSNEGAAYWKDGAWRKIKSPANSTGSSLVNSITTDGRRICGTAGMASISYDADVLRQVPCIWNWDEKKGDFGDPVILPHPNLDYSGRVPQLVTAIDISQDGKTIVGQVVTAVGLIKYPIIYKENEAGEWNYVIPEEKELYPEGFVFPEYPGDEGPIYPQFEAYMTESEVNAYNDAYTAYRDSGYTIPEPQYTDYMTPEEIEAYDKAMAEYQVVAPEWSKKFNAWYTAYLQIGVRIPDYEFNSIRISPDAKFYANTVLVTEEGATTEELVSYSYIYVYDLESGAVTKYEQHPDFILTYVANGGITLAATNLTDDPEGYVLSEGNCIDMQSYISGRVPEYGTWMDENMMQGIDVLEINEDTGEPELVYVEKVITGRPCGTPDLSVIALGVNNVWDLIDDGTSYIFDLRATGGVSSIEMTEKNVSIYDLYGRRLKDATAPGIYIVNGEKKVVR